jgi:hypothetical protein
MIRKLFLGGLGAAAVALALVPSSMAGGASVNKLTISGGDGSFSGFVLSPNEDCTGGRKVTLYKRKSGVRKRNYKRDRKIDSDIATPNGDGAQWSVRDIPSRGKYYAHVKKKGSCKALYSKVKKGTPAPEPEEEEEG